MRGHLVGDELFLEFLRCIKGSVRRTYVYFCVQLRFLGFMSNIIRRLRSHHQL